MQLTLSVFVALYRFSVVFYHAVIVLADLFIHLDIRSLRRLKSWLEEMAKGLQL